MKDIDLKEENSVVQAKDKAQKIVAALYLLTNHIEIENQLRTEVRTQATALLRAILSGSKIEESRDNIISFLSVLVLTKEVSAENASIIEKELSLLRTNYTSVSEPVLSHIFVQEKNHVLGESKETKISQPTHLLRSVDSHTRTLSEVPDSRIERDISVQKLKQTDSPTSQTKDNTTDPSNNKKDEKKARRERVLSLLSKTELKTIKDVSKFFTDCSEKTIQRELNDLVEEKVIVRVGDRRWSTYKLG